MLLPLAQAQAWFVSVDGSVSPLSEPNLAGRVKIAAGAAQKHFHIEGSVSFLPVPEFTLYRGSHGVEETVEEYPLLVGGEVRYYAFSRAPFSRRHDVYASLGADFPVLATSFLPGLKVGVGYSLRLHRKVFMETGLDYYYYGALTNELFVGLGFKGIF